MKASFSKLLLLTIFVCTSAYSKGLEFKIIHMNDTHSHFDETKQKISYDGLTTKTPMGGYARLYERVLEKKQINKKAGYKSLVLHGGDAFQGTLYFTQNKGKMNAKAWNLMGLDTIALGNHEFDIGRKIR